MMAFSASHTLASLAQNKANQAGSAGYWKLMLANVPEVFFFGGGFFESVSLFS